MQSRCRVLASTWLLAAFGGVGYVIGKDFKSDVIISSAAGSLIALAGGTGIFLLWLVDVVVYHRLLVAVTKAAGELEMNAGLHQLREDFKTAVISSSSTRLFGRAFGARSKISVFYYLPTLVLLVIATMLHLKALRYENLVVVRFIWAWHVLLAIFILTIFLEDRPKEPREPKKEDQNK